MKELITCTLNIVISTVSSTKRKEGTRSSNFFLFVVLALTRKNTNAASIMLYLHKLTEVFSEYFKELEEESIRDNFVIVYELLDEMMDFGYPQTTETKILQEYITQDAHKLEVQVRPPMAVTNAVSWRSEGIKYKKNEVFLDVIESVNLLVKYILVQKAKYLCLV
jgi:AP-1 complex subunit mu